MLVCAACPTAKDEGRTGSAPVSDTCASASSGMPAACHSACRTLRDVVPEEERPFRKDGRRSIRFPMASVILRWSSFRLHCPRSGPSIRERRERVSWFDQMPPPACIAPDRLVTSARSFTSTARQPRRRADRGARDRMPALPQAGTIHAPTPWTAPCIRCSGCAPICARTTIPPWPPPLTARSQRCFSQRPDNGNCMATRRPVDFWLRNLHALSGDLQALGIP